MNKNNFLCLVALILTSLIFGISCSKSNSSYGNTTPPTGGGGTGNTISIYGMTYSPASKTVAKGTVVKWVNNDAYAHTVTSDDGSTFNSGNIAGGNSWSYTANTAGTFNYHCTIHGTAMAGTLIVSP